MVCFWREIVRALSKFVFNLLWYASESRCFQYAVLFCEVLNLDLVNCRLVWYLIEHIAGSEYDLLLLDFCFVFCRHT